MQTFSPKYPAESRVLAIGFSKLLAAGETIQGTPTIAVSVIGGVDGNPNAIKSGAAVVQGADVLQRVVGGLDGVDYRLEVTVTTNVPNTIVGEVMLQVRATI